jgi:hypothetical protein
MPGLFRRVGKATNLPDSPNWSHESYAAEAVRRSWFAGPWNGQKNGARDGVNNFLVKSDMNIVLNRDFARGPSIAGVH